MYFAFCLNRQIIIIKEVLLLPFCSGENETGILPKITQLALRPDKTDCFSIL